MKKTLKKTKKVNKKVKKNPYTKFINWCLDECWRIQKELNITSYRISMRDKPTDEDEDYAFAISCGHPYQYGFLKWKVETFEDWKENKDKVTYYLLHEMLHLLVDPLSKIASSRYLTKDQLVDGVEELTDKLAVILRHDIIKRRKS